MSNLTIMPPVGGTVRAIGFQQSQPFTGPDMVNMVPFNPRDGRAILASRPFLTAFTSPGVGGNLLEKISGDSVGNPSTTIVSAVDGELFFFDGEDWAAADVDDEEEITTGRPVFGAAFFRRLFIGNDEADGGLLVYDYELNLLSTPVATAGTLPSDARVLATHMGTLWAAGSAEDGHVLRGSRTGNPFNWDFTAADEGAPFETVGENAGLINEPITALIPVASDMMVVASESSMSMMLGHPSRGGIFFPLSGTVGVLGQGAWCKTDDNKVFALSHKGLIQITAEGDGVASLVSEQKLPNSLKGIPFNRLNPTISLAYDTRWNGIHIIVNDADRPQAWWYDMKNGGFFRQHYSGALPTRLLQFDTLVDFTKSGVLYAGDGYGGMARWTVDGPETSRPQAWAFLGPVRLHGEAGPQTQARVQRAKLTLSNDTDTTLGVLSVFTGADAEDAFLRAYNAVLSPAYVVQSTVAAANNGVFFPRLVGSAMVVVLGDEGSGRFGFESLDLEVVPAGRNRLPKVRNLTYDIEFGLDNYSPDYNLPATQGFATFTADFALSASVSDAPNFIDLSKAPSRWWRGISSLDGREIIATDTANNRLPMHILWFDRANRKGMVAVKRTQDGSTAIRLWTLTSQSAIPAVGSTYGQYAAYADWIEFLWALGDGVDVTGNEYHFAARTAAVQAYTEGPNGFRAARVLGNQNQTIAEPDGDKALFFMSDNDPALGPQSNPALTIQRSVGSSSFQVARNFDSDEGVWARLALLSGGVTVMDTVVFPASKYRDEWAGVGGIWDFGTDVTLHLPTGVFTDSASGTLVTGGTYSILTTDNNDRAYPSAMWQMLSVTDKAVTKAYFEMLHALLDGEFWKPHPSFTPGNEADIVE